MPLAACFAAHATRAPQTATKLYLILDFINGGHLFFQLYRAGIFEEALARVYTAELVLALSHLHSLGIAHRGARRWLVSTARASRLCLRDSCTLACRLQTSSLRTFCWMRRATSASPTLDWPK